MTHNHGKPIIKESAWTDAKSHRRRDLIDRKFDGRLSVAEAAELAILQGEMLHYRDQIAPLPLEDARRLHAELLEKARQATQGQQ